jgi:hypothetical protein
LVVCRTSSRRPYHDAGCQETDDVVFDVIGVDRDGTVDISHALGTPMSRNQALHLAVVHAASGDRTARPVLALDGVYRIAEAKLGAAEAREPCKEPC